MGNYEISYHPMVEIGHKKRQNIIFKKMENFVWFIWAIMRPKAEPKR